MNFWDVYSDEKETRFFAVWQRQRFLVMEAYKMLYGIDLLKKFRKRGLTSAEMAFIYDRILDFDRPWEIDAETFSSEPT